MGKDRYVVRITQTRAGYRAECPARRCRRTINRNEMGTIQSEMAQHLEHDHDGWSHIRWVTP